jgi:hypothetical protein
LTTWKDGGSEEEVVDASGGETDAAIASSKEVKCAVVGKGDLLTGIDRKR